MMTDVIPGSARLRGLKLIVAAAAVYFVLHLLGFQKLFENDAEGIGALLQIIGTLYSVVYALASYVIQGQFAAAERGIQKEKGRLKGGDLFSQRLNASLREH